MSFCHFFTSYLGETESRRTELSALRDKLTYLLASDKNLAVELALFRGVAEKSNFAFCDYLAGVVSSDVIGASLPQSHDEKVDFLESIAAVLLENNRECVVEDVLICRALACMFELQESLIDDAIERIVYPNGREPIDVQSAQRYVLQYSRFMQNYIMSSYERVKREAMKK